MSIQPPRVQALPSDQDASGRTLGDEELAWLARVIASGVLNSTRGTAVRAFEERFAALYGRAHAFACASGTVAVHAALGALDLEPGSEVVTSPVTDFGGVAPILQQGAIPVFADVDPETATVTAATVERCLSDRTRAVVVTHLFGYPVDTRPIAELARARGLVLIEDCAQAYLARRDGRLAGTEGHLACFSLQQGKHITTGEGGIVLADDPALAARVHQFLNKARDYSDPEPDHHFLAINGRMTELQGAVAAAQLPKLAEGVARRRETAAALIDALAGLPGVAVPRDEAGVEHSFWKLPLLVDPAEVPGGPDAMAAALAERGVGSMPRYQRPAYEWTMMREQRTYGSSRYPFTLARPEAVDYAPHRFPGTRAALARLLVLPWNERYGADEVRLVADAVREAHARVRAPAEAFA